jgi:hypothetical protein
MAQPLLVSVTLLGQRRQLTLMQQDQYRPQSSLQSQQWQRQQDFPHKHQYTAGTLPPYNPDGAAHSDDDPWGGNAMVHNGFGLDNGVNMTPQIVSESDGSYANNGDLAYPETASQVFTDKRTVPYDGYHSWFHPHTIGLPSAISMNGSDPDTNSIYSPRSYVSDTMGSEVRPFTPSPVADVVPDRAWTGYNESSYSVVETPTPAPRMFDDVANTNFPERRQIGLGINIPSPSPGQVRHGFNRLPVSYDDCSQYSSDYSYSQKSSPGTSAWFPEGQPLHATIMPYRPRDAQTSGVSFNGLPNSYHSQSNTSSSADTTTWNGPRTTVPPQHHFQDRFRTHRTMDAQTQRKADDEILLQGKKNNLTYKEIRKNMHTKCAESTLRGRYRSLTKDRRDRVRKPVWQEKDVSREMNVVTEIDADHCSGWPIDRIRQARPGSY